MSLYAGIDLHSNNNVLSVIDEHDHVVRHCRLPNQIDIVLRQLEPFYDELAGVAVESTYHWYWLVDGLAEHGYRMHLVNTAAVPQYDGLKYSDDDSDARHLAHLMRLGILPEGYIYPRAERAVRDLLRQRFAFVRQSVRVLQSVQSAWARHTGQRLSANAFRQLDTAVIERTIADANVCFALLAQLKLWHALETQVQQVEQKVLAAHPRSSERQALRTTPGLGPILSLTIALETGAIGRFADASAYCSYCRLVKSERISNGKKKGHGNRKCGNKYLCWAWIEAANYAQRYSPTIKAWYQRKCAKRHRIIAIKALAHKLARTGYYLMRDGGRFETTRAFG